MGYFIRDMGGVEEGMIRLAVIGAGLLLSTVAWGRPGEDPVPDQDDGWGPSAPVEVEPRRPLEAQAPAFGARGQWLVSGDTDISISQRWYESGAQFFDAEVSPSVSYFVAHDFAVGVVLYFGDHDSQGFQADGTMTELQSTTVGAGPTLEYNISLGRRASLLLRGWGRVGGIWGSSRTLTPGYTGGVAPTQSTSQTDLAAGLFAPLLFHPVQHFLLGFGPYVNHDFAKANAGLDLGGQATNVGIGFIVGGYAGGDLPPPGESPNPPRRFVRKLGEPRTVAFMNELNASGGYSERPSSSGGTFSVHFGADAFVGSSVSVGGAGILGYSRTDGTSSVTGLQTTREIGSIALEARLGYGLRLSENLLLWPRAHARIGITDSDDTSSVAENSSETGTINLGLYAPLDLELAPHFIVGIGPEVSRDVVATYGPELQNRSTYLGAGVEVGGWL